MHTHPVNQRTLLYVSELAADVPPSVVGTITKTARIHNGNQGIGGLLIFDGARFAQMLEGPVECIDELLVTLRADQRHTNMQVLALQGQLGEVSFQGWSLAFLLVEDESQGIPLLYGKAGDEAIAAFLTLLSMDELDMSVDISPRRAALATETGLGLREMG